MMLKWLRKLLNIESPIPLIDLDKILTSDKTGNLYLNNQPLDPKRVGELKQEVRMFRNTKLWEIMTNTLENQAFEAGWVKAKTLEDLMNGKAISYTVSVQRNILEKIERAN